MRSGGGGGKQSLQDVADGQRPKTAPAAGSLQAIADADHAAGSDDGSDSDGGGGVRAGGEKDSVLDYMQGVYDTGTPELKREINKSFFEAEEQRAGRMPRPAFPDSLKGATFGELAARSGVQ